MLLISGVKFVHLLAMAVWIGAAAVAPIGMQRSLLRGTDHAAEFLRRLEKATRVIVVAAVVTVVSGFALVELAGGWRAMPVRIYAGTAVTLLVVAIGATLARPTLAALRSHFAAGGDGAGAEPLRRRFVVIANVEMLLRVAVVALMVWRWR